MDSMKRMKWNLSSNVAATNHRLFCHATFTGKENYMGKRLVRDPPMDRRSCYYFHLPSKEPKPEFRYPSAETTKLEQFMVLLNRTRMFDI